MTAATPPAGGDTLAPKPETTTATEAPKTTFVLRERPEVPGTDDTSLRPFSFRATDDELADLKRRIAATRWPERETVTDDTQGVQLDTIQRLADYWLNEHDWRKVEARINSYPNFITNIDGVDIHFIHVRSQHANALPLIITHGWPGSVVEELKIVGPLTDLKRRIVATRWPSKELVDDATQGVQLATIQKLATYWANERILTRGHTSIRFRRTISIL